MSTALYIVIGLAAFLLAVGIAAAWVLGVGVGLLQLFTGIFHVFRAEEPPGKNDASWSRDQAREVGGPDDETRSS